MSVVTTILRKYAAYVLAAVLIASGAVVWANSGADPSPAADNHALIDDAATASVEKSVSKALVDVLSYDFANPGRSEQAADAALVGDARKQYDTLVETLHKKAPGQKLVLSATVEAVGVKKLTDNTATLLVFLDQSSQRAGDKEASISAAQLSVEAVRSGGTWQITDLTTL